MNYKSLKKVKINSRKFDGSIHRSWEADLVEVNKDCLVFVGEFKDEVNHPYLGVIRRGTISYEFYWKNDWFNIFRFHEPEGQLRNFYCNINKPPIFKDNVLDYIDLDIDVLVWKDLTYQILDLEEFEQNARIFKYSEILKTKVQNILTKLIERIKKKKFPFNQNDNQFIFKQTDF